MIRLKWRAEAELFGLRGEFAPIAAEAVRLRAELADAAPAAAEAVRLRAELADAAERAERAERALDAFTNQRRVRTGLALGRMVDWLRGLGRRK